MNKVELLAPAGNFACLKAAINNGANAVYLGGKNFSARAFANNFDENEIIEAVNYAHLRDVKVYVTLNTLLSEKEFDNAIKIADFYYQHNVDALLVQDLGLYYYLKTKYPDFELHCSTQMHVHNLQGVKNAKELGFKRVVIARESSLDFIKEACKENIEIEVFVHGAICVSYSGQCLISSVTKNRSANKGMCAQCCRLKYDLFDEDDNKIQMDTSYPLSPKDMCLVNDIPMLIEAGVTSFKIEGRLKSSAYVGYVTSLYRQAIDHYYENKKFVISDQQFNNLKVLFNRNFTDDYLFNKNNLFGQNTPNHLGIEIGEVLKNSNNFTYIKLSKQLNQFDGIRIGDYGCICNMLYKNKLLVNQGNTGDIVCIKTDKFLNGKVYKTLDFELEERVNSIVDIKIPLDIILTIMPNQKVVVKINDFEYVSELIPQIAQKAPLTNENIKKQFSKLNDTCFYLKNIFINSQDAFLPIKDLNNLRRKAIEAYSFYKLKSFKRNLINSSVTYKSTTYNENDQLIVDYDSKVNYVINPNSEYCEGSYSLISEFGGLLKEYDHKDAYCTLNCSNSYCYEFLKRLGFEKICLSTELNDLDINDLIQAYKKRNNIDIHPYILKQGNRVLMYLKANPFDKYIDTNKNYYINDNNNKFLLRHNNGITEVVEIKDNDDVNCITYRQVFDKI